MQFGRTTQVSIQLAIYVYSAVAGTTEFDISTVNVETGQIHVAGTGSINDYIVCRALKFSSARAAQIEPGIGTLYVSGSFAGPG